MYGKYGRTYSVECHAEDLKYFQKMSTVSIKETKKKGAKGHVEEDITPVYVQRVELGSIITPFNKIQRWKIISGEGGALYLGFCEDAVGQPEYVDQAVIYVVKPNRKLNNRLCLYRVSELNTNYLIHLMQQ